MSRTKQSNNAHLKCLKQHLSSIGKKVKTISIPCAFALFFPSLWDLKSLWRPFFLSSSTFFPQFFRDRGILIILMILVWRSLHIVDINLIRVFVVNIEHVVIKVVVTDIVILILIIILSDLVWISAANFILRLSPRSGNSCCCTFLKP